MAETQIPPSALYYSLRENGINFCCGVPDSTLSSFGFFLQDQAGPSHVVTANEGNAVGLAIGHFLAGGQPALVYMQNAGLGNAVNPLVSLADPDILGIPMLLLIGWRGRPGTTDEPQHLVQGAITEELLRTLRIPFEIMSPAAAAAQIAQAAAHTRRRSGPVALLVPPGTIAKYAARPSAAADQPPLTREQALQAIVGQLQPADVIVATTGKISRELYEHRLAGGHRAVRDLLVVGGMGHASSIAQGLALSRPGRRVVCLDGDGAALMHLGALASIGATRPGNLFHIVLNNRSHESVGGQPTAGVQADLAQIARACGYASAAQASKPAEISAFLKQPGGPAFLNLMVQSGSRPDLARPHHTPAQNKQNLVEFLQE